MHSIDTTTVPLLFAMTPPSFNPEARPNSTASKYPVTETAEAFFMDLPSRLRNRAYHWTCSEADESSAILDILFNIRFIIIIPSTLGSPSGG